jgi:hypothetical protein
VLAGTKQIRAFGFEQVKVGHVRFENAYLAPSNPFLRRKHFSVSVTARPDACFFVFHTGPFISHPGCGSLVLGFGFGYPLAQRQSKPTVPRKTHRPSANICLAPAHNNNKPTAPGTKYQIELSRAKSEKGPFHPGELQYKYGRNPNPKLPPSSPEPELLISTPVLRMNTGTMCIYVRKQLQ